MSFIAVCSPYRGGRVLAGVTDAGGLVGEGGGSVVAVGGTAVGGGWRGPVAVGLGVGEGVVVWASGVSVAATRVAVPVGVAVRVSVAVGVAVAPRVGDRVATAGPAGRSVVVGGLGNGVSVARSHVGAGTPGLY